MELYLIRHGEIEKKYLGRYVGITDVGLSRVGKKQAHRLASFFQTISIDTLYVSQLKRAKQTASPIATLQKTVMHEDIRIAEIDLGSWEGKTSRQVKNMLPKNAACDDVTSGGELYTDFSKRVKDFLDEIRKNHKTETVMVVTHKGVIRELYKYLLHDKNLIVEQEYGGVNQFTIQGKTIRVVETNKVI